jgi:hypothetical protein
MRKILTLYVAPILGVMIILVKLPEIDTWIRNNYRGAPFIIAVILGGATILIHIITVISPFKKFERLEKNKWVLIDNITSRFLGEQLFPGKTIVANVMTPKRVFFCTLVPPNPSKSGLFEKLNYYRKCFFVNRLMPIWLSPNHTLDKRFKITTKQGASGLAYSRGTPILVDITTGINDLNLSDKQKRVISGNGFVLSYPIFALDEKYGRLGNKIIGVVTLSCSNLGAEEIIKEPENKEILTTTIIDFSKICSLIL